MLRILLSALTITNFFSRSRARELCLGICEETGSGQKICVFELEVDLHASELGYYTVKGCEGKMPTLGIERGATYIFDQGHESNYFHPLGLAYYPDGAHDDKDELEPVVSQAT